MNAETRQIEIFDARAQLAKEIAEVRKIHAKYFGPARPFYWTAPNCYRACDCAPTGWYQRTERGLVYLGETMLGQGE